MELGGSLRSGWEQVSWRDFLVWIFSSPSWLEGGVFILDEGLLIASDRPSFLVRANNFLELVRFVREWSSKSRVTEVSSFFSVSMSSWMSSIGMEPLLCGPKGFIAFAIDFFFIPSEFRPSSYSIVAGSSQWSARGKITNHKKSVTYDTTTVTAMLMIVCDRF